MTAMGVAMMGLSYQIVPALITGWLLCLAWVWGDWTLRRIGVLEPPSFSLYRATVALPLGLALIALVTLALNLSNRLKPKWTWLVFSAFTIVQWRSLAAAGLECRRLFVSRQRSIERAPNAEVGIIVVLLGCVFLLDLSWTLAPEIHFDALAAHLPVAKYYGEHPVSWLTYGSVANLVDLLFASALSLYGQSVARLLVLATSVLTTLGVFAFGRALLSARVGLWAAALFFSTPLVSWLSATAYVDTGVTMFSLASLLAFFRWRRDRQTSWLWASGLLLGAAIGAKSNALLGLPVIGLVLLWDLIRSNQSVRERLKGLAGYLLGIGLIAGPGVILSYAITGNPCYPLPVLDKVFKSGVASSISLISNADMFGTGTSPVALLKLPLAFTFETQKFGESLPAGGIGLALMLAPLALITLMIGKTVARQAAILLAVCLVYIGCLAAIMQYVRYYIPVHPVVAVLAATILAYAFKKGQQSVTLVLLGVVVATQVIMSPLMYTYMADRYPIKVAFGLETRESFLARSLGIYPLAQFLNKNLEPGHKVLAVGAANVRFYVNAPMATPGDSEVLKLVARSTPATFASALIQDGFSHIFVDRTAHEMTLHLFYSTEPFLSQFTTLEYANSDVRAYRLREVAVEPDLARNLLPNPGFEYLSKSHDPSGWDPYGIPLIGQTPGQAHSGNIAVRSDADDGLYTHIPVEPGKVYSLGYWCRADRPGQFARLQVNWLNDRSEIIDASIEVVSAESEWAWRAFSAMSPEGCKKALVYVSVHQNSEVWFDDYMFVQGEMPARQ